MKKGKCTNRSGCLLAYRGEILSVPEDNFVCKECKQPLEPVKSDERTSFPAFKTIALGILAVAALALVLLGFGFYRQAQRLDRLPASADSQPAKAEKAEMTPAVADVPKAPASSTLTPPTVAIPANDSGPAPEATKPSPEPAAPNVSAGVAAVRDAAPNLDLADQSNQTTKTEVLKRIDLMPTISDGNKDKLYVSVERARQMGRILSIPFGSGKSSLGTADTESLKKEILAPQIQKLLQDPTAVFVVLGFADTKGDEKTNLRISQERADSTLHTLRDKCGVVNVMHAVAMGGSTLFDNKGLNKNRTAEIWVVLP